ncbi:MAG: hypothetical protein AAFX99_27585 [Myxococcota bacterium]
MITAERITVPTHSPPQTTRYRLTPRSRTSFNTVLDARNLLLAGHSEVVVECMRQPSGAFELSMDIPLRKGRIIDRLTVTPHSDRLSASKLERQVMDSGQHTIRTEMVDFTAPTLNLPDTVYPEVMLPFLLRWQPFDGKTRSLHAWINDRFVARVYYQTTAAVQLTLPSGRRRAIPCTMVPDLNDWVPLGNIVNRLARPLVPKYLMWFDPEPPWDVLRFEGPYGPPGAPEIVLEWLG